MSLQSPSPSPSPYSHLPGNTKPRQLSPKEQETWDAPYIALAQKSNGDLRLLLQSFFSFLHRKTDFYYAHNPEDVKQNVPVKMGFKEGDAEKLLLASFRQFPLRRMPRMSEMQKGEKKLAQEQQQKKEHQRRQQKEEVKKELQQTQKQKEIDSSLNSTQNATIDEKKEVKESASSTRGGGGSDIDNHSHSNETIRYSSDGKQIPVGNGGTNFDFNFQWTQTIHEVSIALPLPPNTRAKELEIQMKHDFLSVKKKTKAKAMTKAGSVASKEDDVNGDVVATENPILLVGKLKHGIRTDESTWTIEDNVLLIVLDKKERTWWDCVLVVETTATKSDNESNSNNDNNNLIDTSLIDSTSKISEYDQATQGMIRKIIFDQRQERLNLPKSDDILRKEAVAKMKNDDDDIIPPTKNSSSGDSSSISMIENNNIPPLPPGVEYIDKINFPSRQGKS